MILECRKYKNEDFEEIRSWYDKRGMTVELQDLPKIGFIVPGIAAGFIMQTDTNCCILEPFIANPLTLKKEREVALDSIFEDLIKESKTLGFKKIFGFSTNLRMVWRAQTFGFRVVETSSLTLIKDL